MMECERSGDMIGDDPTDLAVEYPVVEIFKSVQGEDFALELVTFDVHGVILTLTPILK